MIFGERNMDAKQNDREETLDPQDWSELWALGHRMVDDMLSYLETIRQRPVWQPIPSEVKVHLKQPLPQEPQGPEGAYQDFLEHVLPHPMGNIHPRFWGWVIGTGTPFGMLAEMLAAGMNPNLGGGDHVANYVEAQVLDWCKQMLGYPDAASGLLVSGGSMANLVGLAVARNTRAEFDLRHDGLCAAPRRMVLYASTETHSSVQKAVELLGLGSDAYRQIPVNADFQIDVPALEAAIAQDRAAGYYPFCIVGNAGTVNTGAFDDLSRLADIAQREGMWYHVDGAFGALAALSPALRDLVTGMDRADSIAFDLHKWLYMPMEVGCALVRREEDHRRAFSLTPDYLAHTGERGLAAGSHWFSEYGVQLSRSLTGLPVSQFFSLPSKILHHAYGGRRTQVLKFARLLDGCRSRRPLGLLIATPGEEVGGSGGQQVESLDAPGAGVVLGFLGQLPADALAPVPFCDGQRAQQPELTQQFQPDGARQAGAVAGHPEIFHVGRGEILVGQVAGSQQRLDPGQVAAKRGQRRRIEGEQATLDNGRGESALLQRQVDAVRLIYLGPIFSCVFF
jgi:aromatic-L-amino-acid decarboxylase